MNRIREKYYIFLLKHEEHAEILRDKILEMSIKFPAWFGIQFFFWKAGKLFYTNIGFFTSVYDVFVHVLPHWFALLFQLFSYYIFLDPLIEFSIIILSKKKRGSKRNT